MQYNNTRSNPEIVNRIASGVASNDGATEHNINPGKSVLSPLSERQGSRLCPCILILKYHTNGIAHIFALKYLCILKINAV
jgi:hypothetical protein